VSERFFVCPTGADVHDDDTLAAFGQQVTEQVSGACNLRALSPRQYHRVSDVNALVVRAREVQAINRSEFRLQDGPTLANPLKESVRIPGHEWRSNVQFGSIQLVHSSQVEQIASGLVSRS